MRVSWHNTIRTYLLNVVIGAQSTVRNSTSQPSASKAILPLLAVAL
ncbi:hypothetical protein HZY62_19875 [Maribacter polysiphoniae]|uniref:Uncharacterized protein n=1 Tax=Maribacter polysiphoniae TaxID=429344 RepID=A0ABR7W6T3_9FLAO|nr:hypothetical protein [Maribacter polysiphoniae]MBD1262866.1 hypothetical protein [Maribacter polysiphoniae]